MPGLCQVDAGQVVKTLSQAGVLLAPSFLSDLQRADDQWLSLVIPALFEVEPAQVVQDLGPNWDADYRATFLESPESEGAEAQLFPAFLGLCKLPPGC